MTETTTDRRTIADLIAECRAAEEAFTGDDAAAEARYTAGWQALFRVRPTDPAELALQLRWLIGELDTPTCGPLNSPDLAVLAHIADRLEAMAPVKPHAGAVLLSAAAAAQIPPGAAGRLGAHRRPAPGGRWRRAPKRRPRARGACAGSATAARRAERECDGMIQHIALNAALFVLVALISWAG
jgi:hypothetical protein